MKKLIGNVLAHSDRGLLKVCLMGARILPGEITLPNGIMITIPQYLREGRKAEIKYTDADGRFLTTSKDYMLYVALIVGMRAK